MELFQEIYFVWFENTSILENLIKYFSIYRIVGLPIVYEDDCHLPTSRRSFDIFNQQLNIYLGLHFFHKAYLVSNLVFKLNIDLTLIKT
jgi:hypothetical protein